MKLKKAAALLMGIVLILSPVSSVQASDVSSESQIVVTSEVSNESESESLDPDENESMETQSEVTETSIESTVQSEMDNETETSANDVENEIFQQIGETSGNMTGSYIECELDQNTPIYYAHGRSGGRIPSSYPTDMSAYYNEFPDNRNQNPYGTCWAFSSLGLAEYDLIKDGTVDKNIDLSELQLAYFTFNSVVDPLGGTEGDTAVYYNANTSTSYLNYGGNYLMASRRFGQWVGAANESEVPYNWASSTVTNGLDSQYAYNYDQAHLENTYLINIKKNASDVKRQIIEHGAAGIMYYHDNYSLYWNSLNNYYTYYDTAATGGGHAVMVVGWDDNFSRNNFGGESKPSNDGAWLIRNSWGMYCNYFWMSYETASLADTAWIFDFSKDDGFDNNYQCDGGLNVYPTGYTTLSNVYTVPKRAGTVSESLKAVSFSCTSAANVGYSIEIYTDLKDVKNPESGTLQESAITKGTTQYAGVYTIPLENTVDLKPESSYSVVVKLDAQAMDYEQAISIASGDNKIWDCAVSLGNEKSFYKTGGKFYPFYWGNYCIKAFTANNQQQTYTIRYELNGGINNADNPSEYITGDNDIILKVPTKQGYTFEGWYLDSDYQTPITVIPADTAKEYVLYAKWTENNKNNQLADENKDVLSDGEYIVRSAVDHAYVMDVQWASQENSANVQVYENNGTDAQVWQISHDADHYVIIRSKNSGKALSVQDNSAQNWVNIEQREFKDEKSQKWIALKQSNGNIVFVSAMNTAYCLDLSGAYAANEGNVQVYETNGTLAQQWSVVKQDTSLTAAVQNRDVLPDGEYIVRSAVDHAYVMDVQWASQENSANVQVYENNGTDAQVWQISHDADHYVIIRSKNSGKALSVQDNSAQNWVNIEQREFKDEKSQKWIALKQSNGNIVFVSAMNTAYCLDLSGAYAANEGNVQVYETNGTLAQQWSVVKQDTSLTAAVQNRDVLPDGEYIVRSAVDHAYVMDVQWASQENSANVQVYENNGTDAQVWQISHDADHYVIIRSKNSGKALSVQDNSAQNWVNIVQREFKDERFQKWIALKQSNGNIVFASAMNTAYCIDLSGAYAANEGNVQVYETNGTAAQQWSVVKK